MKKIIFISAILLFTIHANAGYLNLFTECIGASVYPSVSDQDVYIDSEVTFFCQVNSCGHPESYGAIYIYPWDTNDAIFLVSNQNGYQELTETRSGGQSFHIEMDAVSTWNSQFATAELTATW